MLGPQASGSSDTPRLFGLRDRLRTVITTLRHYDDTMERQGALPPWVPVSSRPGAYKLCVPV